MTTPRRALCGRCGRPQSACICRWVAPLHSAVELLILQHPMEVSNAKGSARLLQLSVQGSVMVTGETFDPEQLRQLLYADRRLPVLLYPATPGATALSSSDALAPYAAGLRLVVLDGTWRKSSKMLHLNPLLAGLARLPLHDLPPSQYWIRKARDPDQLSTLEATCHALAQLEGDAAKFQPLRARFADFIEVFAANQGRLGTGLEKAPGDG